MAYVEERAGKKGVSYYLVKTIRAGAKWKKVRHHLADGKKTKRQLDALVSRHAAEFGKRVRNCLASGDALFAILSEEEIESLESIRRNYSSALRKMPPAAKTNFWENFLVDFTYDTNAIEGSTLTRLETSLLLLEGTVPSHKSLREIHEAENHQQSFGHILSYKGGITRHFILRLHKLLMHNILNKDAGAIRKVPVFIAGADVTPPKPELVAGELSKLLEWHRTNNKKYNPVVVAAYFHAAFEGIHPFVDGNGRTGRLVMNYMLMKSGFPPINIQNNQKYGYYEALRKAHDGDLKPLVRLIVRYLKKQDGYFSQF